MEVDVVLNDFDGCMVRHGYDTHGKIQKGPDSETDDAFDFYRSYGRSIVLCTGRSYEATEGILRRMNRNSAVCEHGIDILYESERICLLDEPDFSQYRPYMELLREIENEIDPRIPDILSYMRAQSFSKPQKAYSLGYDIPYRDFDETERVDPHRFFDLVMEVIPSSLKQSFGSRIMVNLNGSTALDFRLPIRKVDGGRYILKRMGIPMERSVMVEDTDVESIRGNWCVACPANAKPEVKNYVSSRGDEGYISPFSYMQREIDILNHLAQSSHTLVDL